MAVSFIGQLTLEDDGFGEDCDVTLGMKPGEDDKVGVELTVGLANSAKDWLLVATEAVKALVEGIRVAESLEIKMISACSHIQYG